MLTDANTLCHVDIEQLTTDAGAYGTFRDICKGYALADWLLCSGSYVGAGYLLSTLDLSGNSSGFVRWLDLDAAVQRTSWTQGNVTFLR